MLTCLEDRGFRITWFLKSALKTGIKGVGHFLIKGKKIIYELKN
jgi:hypothetical protein